MRTILKELSHLPSRIVYMFRYWEYVDWKLQTGFYIIAICLMVTFLAMAQGKIF